MFIQIQIYGKKRILTVSLNHIVLRRHIDNRYEHISLLKKKFCTAGSRILSSIDYERGEGAIKTVFGNIGLVSAMNSASAKSQWIITGFWHF